MNEDYNIIKQKLSSFKRKYYLNKLFRGLLLSVLLLLVLFIAISIFEYFSWSNVVIRTTLFYLFVVSTLFILGFQVIIPLIKLLKMGNTISNREAAIIIGDHFPSISDKLLNTIQLQSKIEASDKDNIDLILAGIEQKTLELKPVPFKRAISYKSNYKYLKWLIIPSAFLIITLIISPAYVTEPASRIVNHDSSFERPAPYSFTLLNKKLSAIQGESYSILVKVEGDEMPESVYVNDGKYDYRMDITDAGLLKYTFSKLKNDIYFNIGTEEVVSKDYHLTVLPKPSITNLEILINYPSYLAKKSELIESTGDIVVPEGSSINWRFFANNSIRLIYFDGKEETLYPEDSDNLFEYSKTAIRDFNYGIFTVSKDELHSDTLEYSVNVIKDEKPSIGIQDVQQNYLIAYLMSRGTISDDYGISSLRFHYRKHEKDEWERETIEIDKNAEKQNFNHSFSIEKIDLRAGDNLEFYYEVWDNDKVNGYKSAKSNIMIYIIPDKEEIEEKADSTSDQMKSKYEKSIKDLDELKKDLENLKRDLFEKKELDWSDRKKVSDLLEKEKQLREDMMEMHELNQQREELKDFLNENPNAELQQKLEELEKQMEKLKDNELLQKLEELTKDIDELSKEQLEELLDDLKTNQEEFQESLEQQLEFFKQLELEQKLGESSQDLKELAEKQKKLSEDTKERKNKLDEAKKEQDDIAEEFEEIEEQLKEIDSLNKELERPMDLDTKKEDQESIEQDMQDSKEHLNKSKRNKSSESQENASQKMNEMANKLDLMMEMAMQSRMGEDIEQVGKILDNLLDISFSLEYLMFEVANTSDNDPRFLDNTQSLKNLKEDYAVLHDSLIAISKRQQMLQQFIVKESNKVEIHMDRALSDIQERRLQSSGSNLQYSMMSANNLALMLEESLDKMKQSMNMPGSKNGDAQCDNPGAGSAGSMQDIMKMQEGLGKGLKPSPGKGEGSKSGKGKESESRELAEMAAQQAELRKQLGELMDQLEGQGGNGSALQKILDQMEMQEKDIVNRKINSETIKRQKDIETRLLQADKALQEREKEERREATEGKKLKSGNPNNDLKYNDITIEDNNNVIYRNQLKLNGPYKRLLKKYLYEIEND